MSQTFNEKYGLKTNFVYSSMVLDEAEEVARFELDTRNALSKEKREFFFHHDADWFRNELDKGSVIIIARDPQNENRIVGKANLLFREGAELLDEGVPQTILDKYSVNNAAVLGGAVVHPEYSGHGIHLNLSDIRVHEIEIFDVDHVFSVVNVENYASATTLFKAHLQLEAQLYDDRDGASIYCFHGAKEDCENSEFQTKPLDGGNVAGCYRVDIEALAENNVVPVYYHNYDKVIDMLDSGYIGIGRFTRNEDGLSFILFKEPEKTNPKDDESSDLLLSCAMC